MDSLARENHTVGMGLQSHASGTPVPRNSRPPPFSLADESASKREQKAGVGLELSVDGTKIIT